MQVKPSQATRIITSVIKAGLTPYLRGSPGIGKSDLYRAVAETYNLKLIDVRLSTCDPCDLTGLVQFQGKKAGYVPLDTFPLEGDEIPKGYVGWLILFDEISSASPSLQASCYKIILDRMVGQHKLHKNVAVCAAGNLETDNAVVYAMSTALSSRFIHLELVADVDEWLDWAIEHKVDHRICSYIKYKPSSLYTFKPDHTDATYACPRTWFFASKLIEGMGTDSVDIVPALSGTVSEGVAREFLTFCKIYDTLITCDQIIAAPSTIAVPVEPSVLFALSGSIAQNINNANGDKLTTFIFRLPVEFQVICLREVVKRNKTMLTHPAIQKWVLESAANLF